MRTTIEVDKETVADMKCIQGANLTDLLMDILTEHLRDIITTVWNHNSGITLKLELNEDVDIDFTMDGVKELLWMTDEERSSLSKEEIKRILKK